MSLNFLKLWASEASQFGRRQDALQPLKWYCSVVTMTALILGSRSEGTTQTWLFGFAAVALLIFFCSYLYLLIKDPMRLQSEEYLLRDRALDIFESKGGKIQISEEGIRNIANPYPVENRLTHEPKPQGENK